MSNPALWSIAASYLWTGLAVAVPFCLTLGRVDSAARGAWAFRGLLLPGAVLLWPAVVVRCIVVVRRAVRDPNA